MVDRARISVTIVRSGILAQEFCARHATAEVAAVYERSFYLRAGDAFVCIGEPVVGNGPSTLIADLGQGRAANSAGSLPPCGGGVGRGVVRSGAAAAISRDAIAVGSIVFTLDRCALWQPPAWPDVLSPDRLAETCAALARRLAIEGPQHSSPISKRIARFEDWLSNIDETVEAIHGIVGLGPGLTPSGDDVLIGALAMLDALRERDAHTVLARAIDAIAAGQTSPLSHCFLRAAVAGHISERFHTIVSSVITGDVEQAIATARTIGHSSGWDMLTGAVSAVGTHCLHRAQRAGVAPGIRPAHSAAR